MAYNTPGAPILPEEQLLPGWRAAVAAYRRELKATGQNRFAYPAAFKAFREVLPAMPEDQAKTETSQAIAYASTNHREWFWGG
jgi:hypothetical protein